MNTGEKRRKRLVGRLFLTAIILIIFYFLAKPLAKIDFQLANLKQESVQLDNRIARLEHDLENLNTRITSHSTSPGIERIARSRLGMTYPGETLYICRDSQGGEHYWQSYQSFEIKTHKLATEYKTKTPLAAAWDIILSIFR